MVSFSCHEGKGPEDVPRGGTMFTVQTYRRESVTEFFDIMDSRQFRDKDTAKDAAVLVTSVLEDIDRDLWAVDVLDEQGRHIWGWGFNVWGN